MITAVFDMVIIKFISEPTKGRIIIPNYQAIKKKILGYHGKVISIGPDFKDKSLCVGDKLYFPRNEGYPIIWKDKTYMALRNRWCHGRESNGL